MAITGIHALLYTPKPDELRDFFKDVLQWDHVDAHEGWLIFQLPPAELGVHPANAPAHEISFMCDDIWATRDDLRARGVHFEGEPEDEGFGVVATMILPGDVKVLLYEPKHPAAI
jgi:hypothetical protein